MVARRFSQTLPHRSGVNLEGAVISSGHKTRQNDEVKGHNGKMDVLLKVVPALPQTAIQSEDSFQSRDAAFDAGRLSLLLERGRKT